MAAVPHLQRAVACRHARGLDDQSIAFVVPHRVAERRVRLILRRAATVDVHNATSVPFAVVQIDVVRILFDLELVRRECLPHDAPGFAVRIASVGERIQRPRCETGLRQVRTYVVVGLVLQRFTREISIRLRVVGGVVEQCGQVLQARFRARHEAERVERGARRVAPHAREARRRRGSRRGRSRLPAASREPDRQAQQHAVGTHDRCAR